MYPYVSTEELQSLVKKFPMDRFFNITAISQFWAMDIDIQHRYQKLGTVLKILSKKTHRIVRRLFNLAKRCRRQPRFRLPKERSGIVIDQSFGCLLHCRARCMDFSEFLALRLWVLSFVILCTKHFFLHFMHFFFSFFCNGSDIHCRIWNPYNLRCSTYCTHYIIQHINMF